MTQQEMVLELARLNSELTRLNVENQSLCTALGTLERERDSYRDAAKTNHELWVAADTEIRKFARLLTSLRYAAARDNLDGVRALLGRKALGNG